MNNSLSFHPVFSVVIIFAIALPLFILFVYREFQREQKFLILRLVALSLVLISLLGLLLHPAYQEEKKSEEIILLTKDYQRSKVDSILQTNPTLKIIRTSDASSYSNSLILKSWYELTDENIFCVVGQGIPGYALDLFQNKAFQFIPASLPIGVTQLITPDNIYVNTPNQLRGTFNAYEKTKLKLLGPGGVEDSAALAKGPISFSLSFTPKQSGEFTYSLVAERLNGSSSIEPLPISVTPEKPLRILVIQKFPTAEVRFLKNFLSGKNHQVVLRSQVSKSNFSYEYANATRTRIDNLRSDLLDSFDLLFIDQKSYNELTALERNDLKRSISKGLGIIFLLNNQKEVLDEFLPEKTRITSKDTVHIRLTSHSYVFSALPIELSNEASIIAVTKTKDRILSGYFFSGQGRIGFQFLQETYRLGIAGNTDDYSSLWTTLMGKITRARESNFKIKLITPFPYYSNEPIDLAVISADLLPSLYADSVRIPMKENPLVDDYWIGRSWAGKSGWHQLTIKQDSTQLNYYVSDDSAWRSLKISNQIHDNQVLQKESTNDQKEELKEANVPTVLFYLLFLFSSAFLWLAPKI